MSKIKKCVLIDDDPDDQELFEIAVKSIDEHIACSFANDGNEGLILLEKQKNDPPDFIFLDLNMPRMDGKECLAEIMKNPVLKKIPVIIFSTSSHPRDKEEALAGGAAGFMTKPPRTAELTAMLKKLFESHTP